MSLLEYKHIGIFGIPCRDNHAEYRAVTIMHTSRERELDKDRRCGWKGRNLGRSSFAGMAQNDDYLQIWIMLGWSNSGEDFGDPLPLHRWATATLGFLDNKDSRYHPN